MLEKKIDLSYPVQQANEDTAVQEIIKAFENSKKPAAFVDYLVNHHAENEVKSLEAKLNAARQQISNTAQETKILEAAAKKNSNISVNLYLTSLSCCLTYLVCP